MSIAAITSSFVTAVRERAVPASQTPAEPGAEMRGAVKGGRRHELVDAMQQVLGSDSLDGKSGQQAVFRFAHALMNDLRKIDAGTDRPTPGVGHAWGRRSYSDLSERLETLATASAKTATPATPLPIEPPTLPVVDMPLQPDPLTATSAALHLMQVPTSRLLEAYAALRQALGDSEPAPSTAVSPPATGTSTSPTDANRTALADFLTRLSATLSTDAPASLPAGSLVNVQA